ncbi:hypothetical protein ACVXZ0_17885 [Staphylococcus aureus]
MKFEFDQPIGENGYIDIEVDGETKRIGHQTWFHMEEDAVSQHIKVSIH